jgi:hypothetical protein
MLGIVWSRHGERSVTSYVYERRSGGWNVDLGKRKELCKKRETGVGGGLFGAAAEEAVAAMDDEEGAFWQSILSRKGRYT